MQTGGGGGERVGEGGGLYPPAGKSLSTQIQIFTLKSTFQLLLLAATNQSVFVQAMSLADAQRHMVMTNRNLA